MRNNEYRLAGELFGLLRHKLGFGELMMSTPTWRLSATIQSVEYRWSFKEKSEYYSCVRIVTWLEFDSMQSVELFADFIADDWKAEHRHASSAE